MHTETFSVTLPIESAEQVHGEVRSGNFGSANDFFAEAIRSRADIGPFQFHELDELIEREVMPALRELEAHPETAVSMEEMRAGLEELHGRTLAAR